jgi:hypothetical protein
MYKIDWIYNTIDTHCHVSEQSTIKISLIDVAKSTVKPTCQDQIAEQSTIKISLIDIAEFFDGFQSGDKYILFAVFRYVLFCKW